jgi:hypothetical protein
MRTTIEQGVDPLLGPEEHQRTTEELRGAWRPLQVDGSADRKPLRKNVRMHYEILFTNR